MLISDGSVEAQVVMQADLPPGTSEFMLLDFSSSLESSLSGAGPQWGRMDDGIMGGRSSSSMRWDGEDQAAVFSGA